MRCEQTGQMMSERLDGRLDSAESALLDEHLVACGTCRAEWRRLQALDALFASALVVQPPVLVRVQVMARLARRDQARRVVVGGTALGLGAVSLALLALAPILFGLLGAAGILPALLSGGPATLAQLFAFLGLLSRALLALLGTFALPLFFLGLCGLMMALTLNSLWIGAVRRARAIRY